MITLQCISIELTNQCQKGCWFCYNRSEPDGLTWWTVDELVEFVLDCRDHGVRAVSFGGGEPLQFAGLFPLLHRLDGEVFRSLTTNGLLLSRYWDELVAVRPNKVHVSIHFPEQPTEVDRVLKQVSALQAAGIRSGVNLLVSREHLGAAKAAAAKLRAAGIGNHRIVYLPMRGGDGIGQPTPSPAEIAQVAGSEPFQSMTCLTECERSPRFCSVGWDRQVAWCSYTASRRPLPELTYYGLIQALHDLPLTYCGETDDSSRQLVQLGVT